MKTLLCKHRVNSRLALEALPPSYGAEMDIRDHGNEIVLAHDPFTTGETLRDYAKAAKSRFLIVNVKSEGVEVPARDILAQAGVENYFFLDLSFPALVKMAARGERRLCARYSRYEPREHIRAVKDLVTWVWADYFNAEGITENILEEFQSWGLKVCLVSPELVGYPTSEIEAYAHGFARVKPDMVCTKQPELWANIP